MAAQCNVPNCINPALASIGTSFSSGFSPLCSPFSASIENTQGDPTLTEDCDEITAKALTDPRFYKSPFDYCYAAVLGTYCFTTADCTGTIFT